MPERQSEAGKEQDRTQQTRTAQEPNIKEKKPFVTRRSDARASNSTRHCHWGEAAPGALAGGGGGPGSFEFFRYTGGLVGLPGVISSGRAFFGTSKTGWADESDSAQPDKLTAPRATETITNEYPMDWRCLMADPGSWVEEG